MKNQIKVTPFICFLLQEESIFQPPGPSARMDGGWVQRFRSVSSRVNRGSWWLWPFSLQESCQTDIFFFSLIPWILTDFCWTYYTCVREGGEGVQLGVAGAADPGAVEGEGFGVGVWEGEGEVPVARKALGMSTELRWKGKQGVFDSLEIFFLMFLLFDKSDHIGW